MTLEAGEDDDAFRVAIVHGLEAESADAHADALRALLARAGVLCLRLARPLDEDAFFGVAALFGPVKDPVALAPDGEPLRYSERKQIIDTGFVLTDALREKLGDLQLGGLDDRRPGLFETFHCDDTFSEAPARVSVLHARALPPSGGGATHFMDMRAAWQRLPRALRDEVGALRVVYAHNNAGAFPPRRAATGPADVLAPVVHPLVRTHPVAGSRALFLDLDRATHVDGMPVAEGRALLQRLQERAEAGAPTCAHAWQDHDVLVWDNASVQHKAGGDFPLGEPRRFWRALVAPETPA